MVISNCKELLRTLSVTIGVITGLLAILGYVVKISMDYQKLKTKVEQNEERDKEERESNNRKFTELYNSRNQTNEALIELTTTVKLMTTTLNQQFDRLDKKIDELKGQRKDN